MTDDPLDVLGASAKKIEGEMRAKLAQLILPYMSIDFETGQIFSLPNLGELESGQKIVVYALAKLALATKNSTFDAAVTPSELQEALGMPGGTVRPRVTKLAEAGLIIKKGNGYTVLPASINKIAAYLQRG